ncbi:MAG: ATP-binding cassette domain-containing protein [Bacteroidetes bacterium]|nr:MAG: ATP-binding cassette domain-containing protein [Bacteroidota bacterium]
MVHLKKIHLDLNRYPTRDQYPFNLKIFQKATTLEFSSTVTFFVGENGTGKSTLLRALCRKCDIHIWEEERRPSLTRNVHRDKLHHALDINWTNGKVPGSFFSSDIFRSFAQVLDEFAAADPGMLRYFGGKSLMSQSHGQSTMSFFRSRFGLEGIYLLDEPETALSPRSQIELLQVLSKAGEAGHAQFIIATHSPILLACPGATLLSFDSKPVQPVDYEDTDYYQIYRDFMINRGKYFQRG